MNISTAIQPTAATPKSIRARQSWLNQGCMKVRGLAVGFGYRKTESNLNYPEVGR
jgi:hypothetical protein